MTAPHRNPDEHYEAVTLGIAQVFKEEYPDGRIAEPWPEQVILVAIASGLDPRDLDWHVEAVHGAEPHDKGYGVAVVRAAVCMLDGGNRDTCASDESGQTLHVTADAHPAPPAFWRPVKRDDESLYVHVFTIMYADGSRAEWSSPPMPAAKEPAYAAAWAHIAAHETRGVQAIDHDRWEPVPGDDPENKIPPR